MYFSVIFEARPQIFCPCRATGSTVQSLTTASSPLYVDLIRKQLKTTIYLTLVLSSDFPEKAVSKRALAIHKTIQTNVYALKLRPISNWNVCSYITPKPPRDLHFRYLVVASLLPWSAAVDRRDIAVDYNDENDADVSTAVTVRRCYCHIRCTTTASVITTEELSCKPKCIHHVYIARCHEAFEHMSANILSRNSRL